MDFLPSKSATLGRSSAEIASLRDAIWGEGATPGLGLQKTSPAGGRSYFLPAQLNPRKIQRVLTGDAGLHPDLEVLEGDTNDWLHVLHRVKSGRDVFFVTNQDPAGGARRFRFRIKAEGVPECWDAMRNEITAIPFQRQGASVELALTLEPLESVLLVFQPERRDLPARRDSIAAPGLRAIPVARDLVASHPSPAPPLLVPDQVRQLQGASWVWYPEGNPAASAPVGTRYFRKTVVVPADRAVKRAVFLISADNEFVFSLNGIKRGQSGGGAGDFTRPAEIELTTALRARCQCAGDRRDQHQPRAQPRRSDRQAPHRVRPGRAHHGRDRQDLEGGTHRADRLVDHRVR